MRNCLDRREMLRRLSRCRLFRLVPQMCPGPSSFTRSNKGYGQNPSVFLAGPGHTSVLRRLHRLREQEEREKPLGWTASNGLDAVPGRSCGDSAACAEHREARDQAARVHMHWNFGLVPRVPLVPEQLGGWQRSGLSARPQAAGRAAAAYFGCATVVLTALFMGLLFSLVKPVKEANLFFI